MKTRRQPARIWNALALAALATVGGRAAAQDEVRNYRTPVLVVETEGHHAPVRTIVWNPGGGLFSAGFDKTVKFWDLGDVPRPVRSIRPPVWRGTAGLIYTMALSKADARGQAFLAVAGHGVERRRGDFTVFRVPGLGSSPTGDPVARLLPADPAVPGRIGHTGPVLCAAFSPDGKILATGGGLEDAGIIFWSVPDFRPTRLPAEHARDVRTLAFTPDGTRLVSAGGDGLVRVWDVQARRVVDRLVINNAAVPAPVNTLAVTPDGLGVIVGNEVGRVLRFDARNLNGTVLRLHVGGGPVENLSVSPDGARLAVSVKTAGTDGSADATAIACDVTLFDLRANNVVPRNTRRVPGLVYGLAFSPDSRRLAYSGGPEHAVFLIDVRSPETPPLVLRGKGTNAYDIGFTADSATLGFRRTPSADKAAYEGFDLRKRVYKPVTRGDLSGMRDTFDGYALRGSLSGYTLAVVRPGSADVPLALNVLSDRNWWSHTFIPPGPGHPRPTVAVGFESGVAVFDLATGKRTRDFVGPTSPVQSLASSPDGRWLAAASADQTLMLYPLAGSDRVPPFGAEFRQAGDGGWYVRTVAPGGFAAGMGLRPGDTLALADAKEGTAPAVRFSGNAGLGDLVGRLDAFAPGTSVGLIVRRTHWIPYLGPVTLPMPGMPASKRHSQALSLMLGVDREWVAWTPRGYYDTSVEGDELFLGWQTNAPYDSAQPALYTPVAAYGKAMYRPDLLDTLWRTSNPLAVLNQAGLTPEQAAAASPPPDIRFADAANPTAVLAEGALWRVPAQNPTLRVELFARGQTQVRDRSVFLNEGRVARNPLATPVPSFTEVIPLTGLVPGRPTRVTVKAFNNDGTPRNASIDVLLERTADAPPADPTAPKPRAGRSVVMAVGVPRSRVAGLPEMTFADNDARGLAAFLPAHLIPPGSDAPAALVPRDRVVLAGDDASHAAILNAFDDLLNQARNKRLGVGDLVTVVLSTHLIPVGDRSTHALLAADSVESAAAPGTASVISAAELADALGALTDYGCRVVLVLDAVRELPEGRVSGDLKALTRDLWANRRVVTLVASKEGPNAVSPRDRQSVFALSLQTAFREAGARPVPTAPFSLAEFQSAAQTRLDVLTDRRQRLGLHAPREVPLSTRFAAP